MSNSQQSQDAISDESLVGVGRRTQWAFVSLFLLILIWPWMVEVITPSENAQPIRGVNLQERLKQLGGRVKNLAFFVNERPSDQAFLEEVFREGNAKVHIGQEGWLYYRPDLEAVYGKGPLYEEPPSVAREKVADTWNAPIEVIHGFANQLKERGIELVIVPVPTKPMVCRSGLGGGGKAETSSGNFQKVLDHLSDKKIKVVNLLPVLERLPESSRFLKEDTHWTPEGMKMAAEEVASAIRKTVEVPVGGDISIKREILKMKHSGDLAEMLDTEYGTARAVDLVVPRGSIQNDPDSTVVLLGDSFVNIYDEVGLGFGDEEKSKLGAGFAAHLSSNLEMPIQTIAINGDGATAVRREFASLPDSVVRSKKVVVWVLSARDLLLAELPARRAGIRWIPVEFRDAEVAPVAVSKLVVTATVGALSRIPDPRETAYKDAVYSLLLSEFEIENGDYDKEEIFAFAWAFKDRVLQDSSRLEQGKHYRFVLVPLRKASAVSNATRVDDLFRADLDPWFISEFEELP